MKAHSTWQPSVFLVGPGLPLIAGALLATGISVALWGMLSWMGWLLWS